MLALYFLTLALCGGALGQTTVFNVLLGGGCLSPQSPSTVTAAIQLNLVRSATQGTSYLTAVVQFFPDGWQNQVTLIALMHESRGLEEALQAFPVGGLPHNPFEMDAFFITEAQAQEIQDFPCRFRLQINTLGRPQGEVGSRCLSMGVMACPAYVPTTAPPSTRLPTGAPPTTFAPATLRPTFAALPPNNWALGLGSGCVSPAPTVPSLNEALINLALTNLVSSGIHSVSASIFFSPAWQSSVTLVGLYRNGGGLEVPLQSIPGGGLNSNPISTAAFFISAALAQEIEDFPCRFYVRIDSLTYPNGEVSSRCLSDSTPCPPPLTTTAVPTTLQPTTGMPTLVPTTAAPTTVAPTSAAPTTAAPSSAAPTTVAASTTGIATTTTSPATTIPATTTTLVSTTTPATTTILATTIPTTTVSIPTTTTTTMGVSTTPFSPAITIDITGPTGQYTSMAVVDGFPAVSYFDFTNTRLMYIRALDDEGMAFGPPMEVDDSGATGDHGSLAVVDGFPAISYRSNLQLNFVRALDAQGSSWGAPVVVDGALFNGEYTSLAVLSDGFPAISYYNAANSDLNFVRANDVAGTTWGVPVIVDGAARRTGLHTSLVILSNGNPGIAYYDIEAQQLRFVSSSSPAGLHTTWGTPVVIDNPGNAGQFVTAADIVSNFPAVAYYDNTNQEIKFARALDVAGSAWGTPQVIESNAPVGSGYTSLAVINGIPSVAFFSARNTDLRFINAADAQGLVWNPSLFVDGFSSIVGVYTTMKEVKMQPAIAYHDFTSRSLKYARLGPPFV